MIINAKNLEKSFLYLTLITDTCSQIQALFKQVNYINECAFVNRPHIPMDYFLFYTVSSLGESDREERKPRMNLDCF